VFGRASARGYVGSSNGQETKSGMQRDAEKERKRETKRAAARANVSRSCWCTEQKICTVQQTPLSLMYTYKTMYESPGVNRTCT